METFKSHQLDIFYYVGTYKGIAAAAKHMPYGIQPSAISKHMTDLERFVGGAVFHRRKFAFTELGQELFDVICPYREKIEAIKAKYSKNKKRCIRVAASPIILRDYVSPIVCGMMEEDSKVTFRYYAGPTPEVHRWLQEDDIDLAVMPHETACPPGCCSKLLFELDLALVVPAKSPYHSPEQIWKLDPIEEPLLAPLPNDILCRLFQRGLRKLKVDWHADFGAGSFDLVETSVRDGVGIGLSVAVPGRKRPPGMRELRLRGFPKLKLEMVWRRDCSPLVQRVMAELEKKAALLRRART